MLSGFRLDWFGGTALLQSARNSGSMRTRHISSHIFSAFTKEDGYASVNYSPAYGSYNFSVMFAGRDVSHEEMLLKNASFELKVAEIYSKSHNFLDR